MEYLRGVNLGGWLVAEYFMTPSLFKGVLGCDETAILNELGDEGRDRLSEHHKTFITEDDFAWLAKHGVDAVRLPVPHWVFGDIKPYVGSIKSVDFAFAMAQKHGLKILLDLHTAPGSQNGKDHSGKIGPVRWHLESGAITQTLEIVEKLALRYGSHRCLWGIELLNEPDKKIPSAVIEEYYRLGYAKVRAACDPSVVVVMHDAFRPDAWESFFTNHEFDNAALDMHLYHAFAPEDKKLDIHKQLKKVLNRRDMLEQVQEYVPVVVGEWSLGLSRSALRGLDSWEADKARQAFGTLQLNTYQKTLGWFFWSYKTDDPGGWSFRYAVEKGWLPSDFDEPVVIETVM